MNCEEQNAIKIFRGDDTDWNGKTLLHFKVTSDTADISTMTAEFILGSIVKSNIPLDEGGEFDVNYSHAETSSLPWGPNKGVLKIFDSEGRIKTVSNSILFFVTSEVVGEQGETIIVPVPETSPVQIELTIGGGSGGGSWGSITGDIQNQEDLQAEFATKQDIISDLSTIRSGATAGATAVQPATLETALATKQNELNATQLEAVNSGANSANIAQISTNTNRISGVESKIPAQASSENQLADKNFVNSSISTNTANFIGTFENVSTLEAYSGTVTNNDYAFVINSVVTDNGNDWATLTDLNAYDKTLLTNFDYAWVVNGNKFDLYRFDIVLQTWGLRAENVHKADVTLNTAYNRYKATVASSVVTWEYEYTLNNSSFTANQWAAINSGATSTNIAQIAANTTAIAGKQDIIGDLSSIRSGAALGATSVQPADLENYATTSDLATRAHQADGVTIIDSGSAITTVAVKEQRANTAIKQWVGTKAQYDAITKDEDTLYIVTDDNQGGGGTDLESIDGYDANVPVQRLANLGGNFKWQTKSVVCDNFNQYNYLTPNITWPDTVNTVDLIIELTAFIPDTSEYPQNIIIFNPQGVSSSLFYGGYQHNPRGGFGYWNGTSNVWYNDTITQTPATKWIRLTGTNGNLSVYCLDDNNYTLETLPELASWTYQGVCTEAFGNSTSMQFSNNNAGAFKGVLKNWQIKANDSVVFDLRNDNSVVLTNSNTQAYKVAMGIQKTETWK